MLGGDASGVGQKCHAENAVLAVGVLHQHHVEHLELEELRVCKALQSKAILQLVHASGAPVLELDQPPVTAAAAEKSVVWENFLQRFCVRGRVKGLCACAACGSIGYLQKLNPFCMCVC